MSEHSNQHGDSYAAAERQAMVKYQGFKQRLLKPLLVLLEKMHVQPWMITGLSLITGLAFCPVFLIADAGWSLHVAYILLLLHLLLDGLDGPLARHLNMASKRGSFVDTMADQIVVAAVCVVMIAAFEKGFAGGVTVYAGGTHLFLYTCVVAFAVVRNGLGISYRFVMRPRNFVYGWLFAESYFLHETRLAGSIEWCVWFFNAILLIQFATGYFAIRNWIGQHLDSSDDSGDSS